MELPLTPYEYMERKVAKGYERFHEFIDYDNTP